MHSDDIKRIHIADLRTKYGNQGLDIIGKTGTPHVAHLTTPIEMRAIYACLPMDFDNDGDGKKVRRLFLCLKLDRYITHFCRRSGDLSFDRNSKS